MGAQTNQSELCLPHSAAEELFALQVAQYRHDESYHREIARLTVHARLNHMALHFCKYVGQIAEALARGPDEEAIRRTIVDSFIIDLCAANTLNLRLASVIPAAPEVNSIAALGHRLLNAAPRKANREDWLLTKYAVQAGKIARACEKIDHLEAYPFREAIVQALGAICETSMMAAANLDFDLVARAGQRLADVERGFIFDQIS
jgi:hypothetical protein